MTEDEFVVPATPAAREYLSAIATEMANLFGIDRREAVGRMNKFWGGRKEFLTEMQTSLLTHEDPTFWAKTVYYREPYWWRGEEGLLPRNYP